MTEITCPECKEEVEVEVIRDRNYGADADGNRGMEMIWTEFDHNCDGRGEGRISDLAMEAYRNQ